MRLPPRVFPPLLLLLTLLWPPPAALAQPANGGLYRVEGIPVDATAASAVQARQDALAAGQREGLRRLLERLTRPEDAARLPKLDRISVDRYVESLEITNERLGPTRYLATLNIAYSPPAVRELLRGGGLAFLERRPEPVLVLPALAAPDGGGAGSPDLWGEANPWRAAWNTGGAASPLVDLRLPLGDAGDVTTVPPEAAADLDALARLGERYGASVVVIAEARPSPGALALEARRADRPGEPFLRETLRANPGEDEAALLGRGVARVVAAVESDLKRTRIAPPGPPATLQAGVPLVDLSTWVQIRQELGSLPEVRSVRVDRFGRGGATVTLAYVGGLDTLVGALGRRGLSLVQESGGWQLRQAGGLGGSPPPSPASPPTR